MQGGAGVRSRRSTEELRAAILDSARALFSERGYAATSTRDIAIRAGAVEALIFKHFKTKARLFRSAILEPLEDALDSHLGELEDRLSGPVAARQGLTIFVETLFPTIRDNDRLLVAYLNATTFHHAEVLGASARGAPLSGYLDKFERIGKNAAEVSGLVVNDLVMETRLTFAVVAAVALFQDILFAGSNRDIRSQQAAVVRLLSDGIGKVDLSARKGRRATAR